MTSFVVGHALWTGLAIAVLLGFSFVGLSILNQEIWLGDLPKDIQEAWGPQSRKAQIQKWVFGLPILGLALAGLIWSTLDVVSAGGPAISFVDLFLHTFVALSVFNVIDLVIIDWLVLVKIRPSFAILPGTEDLAGNDSYRFHWHAFLIGTGGITVLSVMVGGVSLLL